MSSITLPSQTVQPATPLTSVAAAGALVATVSWLSAPLRSALAFTAGRLLQWRRARQAHALRARAQRHLRTDASYAADLLAAANAFSPVVERA